MKTEDMRNRASTYFDRARQVSDTEVRAVWLGMAQRWLEQAELLESMEPASQH
jgi:hypothetical protein